MKNLIKVLLVGGSILATDLVSAQTAYIRDTIYVPLRSGEGSSYRIIHKGMRSGSKLEVLQVSEESGYTKVRTSKGIEGWLQNQYLSYEPVASLKLVTAEKEIARLTTDNKALSSSKNELSGKSSNLSSLVKKLEKENASLTKELNEIKTISSGALKLNEDNLKLTESTQLLKTKIDLLEADNTRLQGENT